MTEAKHTTGSWAVGSSTGHNACHVYAGDDSICTVYGIFAHQSVEQVERDQRCAEGLANARLIAAAPDALVALKESHKALSQYEWYAQNANGLRAANEAAIAKAEGRT